MLKIRNIPIDEIKPYPENNRINDDTVEALVKIYDRIGFNVPLVVDEHYVIVKGHARHKAAVKYGYKSLPCIISQNTDEVNNKDRILDNRISELSRWDNEKLTYEIDGLEIELGEMGLQFRNLRPEIADVTKEDIEQAEGEQFYEDDSPTAMLSVVCPKCGGYFEYKAKSY